MKITDNNGLSLTDWSQKLWATLINKYKYKQTRWKGIFLPYWRTSISSVFYLQLHWPCCCSRAFLWLWQGAFFSCVQRLLTVCFSYLGAQALQAQASAVVAHVPKAWAPVAAAQWPPCSTWNLPGPGVGTVSPALASGFLSCTTRKSNFKCRRNNRVKKLQLYNHHFSHWIQAEILNGCLNFGWRGWTTGYYTAVASPCQIPPPWSQPSNYSKAWWETHHYQIIKVNVNKGTNQQLCTPPNMMPWEGHTALLL